ncbi:hypothetical protein EV651_109139 [Kribbella sp. VKM Ac-2571]|uniref:hypothetical protein n=1 Tax=Kribbella sp. VKM Ac-2571 TaxID=2512222 RepID=UPI00106174A6|nr:hypothetical protein [Kribbella sp. VKM Ac-2571]TDO58864.1 hypothetical protein EV651_109139 [Kribbella sp. VKM Ac-2571]
MLEDDTKRAAQRALVDRILTGDGRASAEQRARAFNAEGLVPPLSTLISKITRTPVRVSQADLAVAGYTEDEVFELVVCAAVGHSTRLYEAGLAALAEAVSEEAPGHAS